MSGDVRSDLQIRPAQSLEELHACVDLQMAVWGFPARDVVPFHQLHTAHQWGGLVLVAVDAGRVVGFCYGFGGRQYGRPALLSHMLAVLPEYRGRDLGARLKLAQAEWALANGYDLITWTYDPLQAVNANLNINRLGGVVRRYLVDHYGPMTDGINRGLPSDRLLVEWHLRSPRVQAALRGGHPPQPPVDWACRIPRDLGSLKRSDPEAAYQERIRVRTELCDALGSGHVITGFRLDEAFGQYLLSRKSG